jgi:hypothetical protein
LFLYYIKSFSFLPRRIWIVHISSSWISKMSGIDSCTFQHTKPFWFLNETEFSIQLELMFFRVSFVSFFLSYCEIGQ